MIRIEYQISKNGRLYLLMLIIIFISCLAFALFKANGFHFRSTNKLISMKLSMNRGVDPYTAVMIIPTGVGASIGGYAGDGLPSAKLLASVADIVITHPNVMNGASLYWPSDNILYVEGFALDEFANQRIGLRRIHKSGQKIGLLLDKAMEEDLRIRHIQVADAARATLGINVADCVVTSHPVQVEVKDVTDGQYGMIILNHKS
jgi:Protein of unknown function (DUF3326)